MLAHTAHKTQHSNGVLVALYGCKCTHPNLFNGVYLRKLASQQHAFESLSMGGTVQ